MAGEGIARFSAGDMERLAELYAPDAISVAPDDWPEGGRFEGRDAVMRQFARVQEEWGRQSMSVQREKGGGDWAVLELTWNAEGRASGVALEMRIVGAYRLDDEKIAEARFFWDFDQALAAVGLSQ